MSKVVLIVIGILLLACLLLFLAARIPAYKARIGAMNKWVALAVAAVLIGALTFIVIKVFFPGGPESIFADVKQGSEEGQAPEPVTEPETEPESQTGSGFGYSQAVSGNSAGDETVYITVSRDRVKIGDVPFSDEEALKNALASLSKEADRFCLVDEYAVASRYHSVENILKEAGIRYSELEKD